MGDTLKESPESSEGAGTQVRKKKRGVLWDGLPFTTERPWM